MIDHSPWVYIPPTSHVERQQSEVRGYGFSQLQQLTPREKRCNAVPQGWLKETPWKLQQSDRITIITINRIVNIVGFIHSINFSYICHKP